GRHRERLAVRGKGDGNRVAAVAKTHPAQAGQGPRGQRVAVKVSAWRSFRFRGSVVSPPFWPRGARRNAVPGWVGGFLGNPRADGQTGHREKGQEAEQGQAVAEPDHDGPQGKPAGTARATGEGPAGPGCGTWPIGRASNRGGAWAAG